MNQLRPQEPAAHKQVLGRIAKRRADRGLIGLEGDSPFHPARLLRVHAKGQRYRIINFNSKQGTRTIEIARTRLLEGVSDRQLQMTDREFSCFVQGDDRATLLYKITKRFDTLFAYAPGVFIRHPACFVPRTPSMSLDNGFRALIGNHNRVQSGSETAASQVSVEKTSIRKFILFQEPPRPAFVHAGNVALIKPDPGGIQSKPRPSKVAIGCVERKVSVRSHIDDKVVQFSTK